MYVRREAYQGFDTAPPTCGARSKLRRRRGGGERGEVVMVREMEEDYAGKVPRKEEEVAMVNRQRDAGGDKDDDGLEGVTERVLAETAKLLSSDVSAWGEMEAKIHEAARRSGTKLEATTPPIPTSVSGAADDGARTVRTNADTWRDVHTSRNESSRERGSDPLTAWRAARQDALRCSDEYLSGSFSASLRGASMDTGAGVRNDTILGTQLESSIAADVNSVAERLHSFARVAVAPSRDCSTNTIETKDSEVQCEEGEMATTKITTIPQATASISTSSVTTQCNDTNEIRKCESSLDAAVQCEFEDDDEEVSTTRARASPEIETIIPMPSSEAEAMDEDDGPVTGGISVVDDLMMCSVKDILFDNSAPFPSSLLESPAIVPSPGAQEDHATNRDDTTTTAAGSGGGDGGDDAMPSAVDDTNAHVDTMSEDLDRAQQTDASPDAANMCRRCMNRGQGERAESLDGGDDAHCREDDGNAAEADTCATDATRAPVVVTPESDPILQALLTRLKELESSLEELDDVPVRLNAL